MRCVVIFFLLVAINCSIQAAERFRTFEDTTGRKMEARITQVSGNDVYIERKDGLRTKVNISVFIKDDQQYIRNWAKEDVFTSGAVSVRFKTHISEKSGWSSSDGIRRKTWQEGYEIVLTNDSDYDLKDVRVEYLMIKFEDALAAQKRSEGTERTEKGSARIASILPREQGSSKTKQFSMQETKLESGYYWTDGGKKTSKDELRGIWVKVYSGNVLITQISKPKIMSSKYSW